jgi:hypothetical protein
MPGLVQSSRHLQTGQAFVGIAAQPGMQTLTWHSHLGRHLGHRITAITAIRA